MRLLRISWKDKKTNECVLEELSTSRSLLHLINKKKLKYLGHALRNTKTDLMASMFQGKAACKRNRGRPPTSYMDNVTAISALRLSEVVHLSRDREDWRNVVTACEAATFGTGDADR